MGADGNVPSKARAAKTDAQRPTDNNTNGLTAQLRFCNQRSGTGHNWSRTSLPRDVQGRIEHIDSAAYGIAAILQVLQADYLAECAESPEVLGGFTAAGLFVAASLLARSTQGELEQLRDAYPERPR